jgi:hypothetical protein
MNKRDCIKLRRFCTAKEMVTIHGDTPLNINLNIDNKNQDCKIDNYVCVCVY